MANIKEHIEDIMYVIKSMIDSGIFPDIIDLRKGQDYKGYNDFFIEFHIGKENTVAIEIQIRDLGDGLKSFVEVYDITEDGEFGSEKLLIPYLKDYLAKHPLLQFPDSPNGFEEVEYYLNKCIPPEYAKETYIALALIIQDFFTDSLWYISLEHTWGTNPTPPH